MASSSSSTASFGFGFGNTSGGNNPNDSSLSGSFNWSFLSAGDDARPSSYGEEAEEEEEGIEGEETQRPSEKDCVVFLIDASASMFEMFDAEKTYFHRSLEAAHEALRDKIVSSERDLIAVVFFGTDKDKNSGGFKHIWVLQELDNPDIDRIHEIERFLHGEVDFGAEFGQSEDYSLNDVFWACSNMFSASKIKNTTSRILLFTNNDNPHSSDPGLQAQVITKCQDLEDIGIGVDLIHMARKGRTFDYGLFYNRVITDKFPEGQYPKSLDNLQDLVSATRSKASIKRALMRIPFTLAPNFDIGVSCYKLVSEATKGSYVYVEDRDNKPLTSHTRYFCKDTQQPLLPADIKSAYVFGGEKVIFEKDEVQRIKNFDSPGLVLLGFKPRDKVKMAYNVKEAYFLYPDETVLAGSSKPFVALWKKLLEMDKVAICRLIPRVTSAASIVALLPQREQRHSDGSLLVPSGFYMIFLPFAEDMRKLPYERNLPKATDEEVDIMQRISRKLLFKDLNFQEFRNPSLAKHYGILEAHALRRDTVPDPVDVIEPQTEQQTKLVHHLVDAFRGAVYPPDYDPESMTGATGAKKRKNPEGESSPKRAKASIDVSSIDVREYHRNGTLKKLTLPVLSTLARDLGVKPLPKKKDDVIAAIEEKLS